MLLTVQGGLIVELIIVATSAHDCSLNNVLTQNHIKYFLLVPLQVSQLHTLLVFNSH